MSQEPERGRGMRDLSKESVDAANAALKEEELELLKTDIGRLERLRPQLRASSADFEKLLVAVQEATQQNEDVAVFRERLKALGEGVLAVAKKAAVLL